MLSFFIWTAAIVVAGFMVTVIWGTISYARATPEEKAKLDADAKTMRTPVKERLELAGYGVDKLYEVRRCGIALDIQGKQLVAFNGSQANLQTKNIPFATIRGVDLNIISSSETVTSGGGSLTGAVVGAAVAGPLGAVIGARGGKTNSRTVETIHGVNLDIKVDDLLNPVLGIPFLKTDWAGLDQNSAVAIPSARDWQAIIETIVHRHRAAARTREQNDLLPSASGSTCL